MSKLRPEYRENPAGCFPIGLPAPFVYPAIVPLSVHGQAAAFLCTPNTLHHTRQIWSLKGFFY